MQEAILRPQARESDPPYLKQKGLDGKSTNSSQNNGKAGEPKLETGRCQDTVSPESEDRRPVCPGATTALTVQTGLHALGFSTQGADTMDRVQCAQLGQIAVPSPVPAHNLAA